MPELASIISHSNQKQGTHRVGLQALSACPSSYDVLLDGVIIIASLVQSGPANGATWTAELLTTPPWKNPAPFKKLEHTFGSLEEVQKWLGHAEFCDAGESA
jgi:hypothetical protein